jgi:hypothetical protein
MEQLLLDLMRRLEAVGNLDESLYDTVVREKMSDPIFFLFLKPTAGYVMPDDYGMCDEDNRLIKAALQQYIDGALAFSSAIGLGTFHMRLAAFQGENVRTEQSNYFDDFFGWYNPASFDEEGNVIY